MTGDTPFPPGASASRGLAVPPQRHPRLAVAVLCGAGIVVALMQTIIVPLIPQLPALLHTSATNASWALTITLLVGAVITPISGRLSDMFGKRRVLLLSLLAVSAGSVVCALSSSLIPFLVGRGMQGLGIGTIAVGISLMRDIVPADRLASSVGAMSASLGVGGALGLPFAAAIAQHVSWHALFWTSAAVAAAAVVAVTATVPAGSVATGGRFDGVGALGLTVLLACILLPLSKGAEWGWSHPLTVGLLAGFVVSATLWWRWERRRPAPLVDLSLNVQRPILLTNVASVMLGFAFYAMQMIPIQVLMAPTITGNGLGLPMFTASLVLMPGGLVMFVFSYVSAWLTARRGPRVSLAVGTSVIGAGYLLFLILVAAFWPGNWVWLLGVNILVGAGLGISYSAMPALIMRWVPVSHTGEANGVNALMRSVGTATATAVVGMILAAWTTTGDGLGFTVPNSHAYLVAAAISFCTCLIAAATALAIPRGSRLVTERVA